MTLLIICMSYRFDEKFAISDVAVCPVVSIVLELPVLQRCKRYYVKRLFSDE